MKNIFSTINLRIFTYLSLYNNFTLSYIHNSLYFIYRTLRAHNSNRFQKRSDDSSLFKENNMFASSNVHRNVASTSVFKNLQKNEIMQNDLNQSKNLNKLRQTHFSMSWRKVLTHQRCWCSIWTNDLSKRNVDYEIAKNFKNLKKWKRKFVLWNEKRVRLSKNQRRKSSQNKSKFFRIIWCNQFLFQKKSLRRLFRVREKTWQRRVNERLDLTKFFYITTNQSKNIEIMSESWRRFFVWSSTTFRRRTRRLYTLCNF